MSQIICTGCQAKIDPLAEFPGRLCVDCYSVVFDSQPAMTADELADMFRNPLA
jgi:hypothetical protein